MVGVAGNDEVSRSGVARDDGVTSNERQLFEVEDRREIVS
jgi:hypothetical protein